MVLRVEVVAASVVAAAADMAAGEEEVGMKSSLSSTSSIPIKFYPTRMRGGGLYSAVNINFM